MPGVPFGRGCDPCRRQKKKHAHDVVVLTLGVRAPALSATSSRKTLDLGATGDCSSLPVSAFQARANIKVCYSPSNEATLLVDALIAKLKTYDDLRYHLSWTFGGFIEDIPRRLGTSKALDTAVVALLGAHSNLACRPGVLCPVSLSNLRDYSRALKALRLDLDNPSLARKAETLCAVMLLLICQSFLGISSGTMSAHGEGAGNILKARGYYNVHDEFECKLLLSLRGPVLFEALINPRICFSSKEWNTIVEINLDGEGKESIMMQVLAQAPDIMRRGRIAVHEQLDLELLIEETRYQYTTLKATLIELHAQLDTLPAAPEDKNSWTSTTSTMTHAYYQRTFGLCLAICIVFNCILKALDPTNTDLELESASFRDDVLQLATQATRYRPLGASFVTLCLIAAWCNCSHPYHVQDTVKSVLLDYMRDFAEPDQESLEVVLRYTSRRLALLEV